VPEAVIKPIITIVFNTNICNKYNGVESDNSFEEFTRAENIREKPDKGKEVVQVIEQGFRLTIEMPEG